MMQQVNLLTGEQQPRRERLTARQLVLAWGSFAALLLLVSCWQGIGLWRLAVERADNEALWRALDESNSALRTSFSDSPDTALVTEVEELRRRLDNQALLVNAVEAYERAREGGFSPYLQDLAARHVEGMALSRIELHDGGSHILLSGETDAPVNVPRFLKRLSEGPSFRGHRFDELRLEAQESGLLRFDITGPHRERQG